MTDLKSQFHKAGMWRLDFPHSVCFPATFEEFQDMHFFDRKIIPHIHQFVENIDKKIQNFCKTNSIAVYTQPFVVERDVQVEFGVWVPSAGACVEIYGTQADVQKIYDALPDILKDHRASKKMRLMIDEALEETICAAPDNIWQILMEEPARKPMPDPFPGAMTLDDMRQFIPL